MEVVSHIDGRTRIKFHNANELHLFLKNTKHIPGLIDLSSNETTLTSLINYEIHSPFAYILNQFAQKPAHVFLTKEDVSAYVVPILVSPLTKAAWLIILFGLKVGFLQFAISSMLVNKYIKTKFE